MRTRCRHCGAVRAKNTTRQFEHLQTCNDFLNSNEGREAMADGSFQQVIEDTPASGSKRDIFRGGAPNPNLNFKRPRVSTGRPNASQTRPAQGAPPKPAPSLVNHLLAKNRASLEAATQQQFLSHAGCGTLSSAALGQWLTQQGHMSRALIPFIGNVIGRIRLQEPENPNQDTNWRTVDLLVSCINNAKRELEFLRSTQQKYGLENDGELAKHATKGFTDLFGSASSPGASLLEGMVVLWSVEYVSFAFLSGLKHNSSTNSNISSTTSHGNTPAPSYNPARLTQHHTLYHPTSSLANTTCPTLSVASLEPMALPTTPTMQLFVKP